MSDDEIEQRLIARRQYARDEVSVERRALGSLRGKMYSEVAAASRAYSQGYADILVDIKQDLQELRQMPAVGSP